MKDELAEALVAKMESMEASLMDIKQTAQQAAQDSQQAVQSAKQVEQTIGSLQSDFSSRTSGIVSDADSVKADERMRATAARGNDFVEFKTNTFDYSKAMDLIRQQEDTRVHEKDLKSQQLATSQAGLDAYRNILIGATQFINAKWQQELRHSDIATENQWEDPNEVASNALSGEIAKSLQVPPAATEYE
jgi:hypothetical protein